MSITLSLNISSQVIYADIADTVIEPLGGNFEYVMDLNGDSIDDFTFVFSSDTSGYLADFQIKANSSGFLSGVVTAGLGEAKKMNCGDTVYSSSVAWHNLSNDLPVITYLNGQSFGSQFNGGVVDGCIGVLFTDSLLNIYYGWIRMDVMHSQLKVVIKDYAYNPFGDEVLVCDTSSVCNMATSMVLNVSSVDETFLGANDGSATASVIGGYPPYSYLWNSNSNSAFIDSLSPGTYYVSVTDSMGCVVSDSVVVMSGSARFFDIDENNVSIYPNPTRSDLFIITSNQIQAGYLYGLNGKLLNVFNSDRIDMSFYQSGIYLLKIYTNEGVCLFRVLKN
ncbi:MAG: hypothetical protein CL824_05460 [Crocinitomicaceae bacterium]|nr:hypothetical protein [Crocinitomicaceae bacterium]